jgi:PAS domain S-box-containing protein
MLMKDFNGNKSHLIGEELSPVMAAIENINSAFAIISTIRNELLEIVDFSFKYINKYGLTYFSSDQYEIKDKKISEVIPDLLNLNAFDILKESISTRQSAVINKVSIPNRVNKKAGNIFIDIRVTPDADNLYLTWTEADEEKVNKSLERMQAEEIVRIERQRFFDVLETLPVYLILLSEDHQVPFANKFFREKLGDPSGKQCFEFLFGLNKPCDNCETYKVLETGKEHRWEWTGPDGHIYDIYDFPFIDTDGSRLIMEMGIDITDRRNNEIELVNHRLHLESLVKERTARLENVNEILKAEVTERKNTEIELELLLTEVEQRAAELDAILNSIPDGISIVDVEGKILNMNSAANKILGINTENLDNTIEGRLQSLQITKENGIPFSKEESPTYRALNGETILGLIQVIKYLGESKLLSVNAAPILLSDGKKAGAVTTFSDITEAKRIEEILIKERSNLEALFDVVNIGMLLIDGNGVVKRVNNTLSRWLGKKLNLNEDFQAGDIIGCIYAVNDNAGCGSSPLCSKCSITESFQSVQYTGKAVHAVETELSVVANGSVKKLWFEINADPITLDGDSFVILSLNNITERKERIYELKNLNRTLIALSHSSQAMMHAENENDYMNAVCKIITEDCGHSMVWIGFAENDSYKSVIPAAYAGFDKGYLETLKLSWADVERGRGPTGSAIRNGELFICKNMLSDSSFSPWREEALKRGYASSIALPLKDGKKVFGAITIYSGKPDPFSGSEVELLSQLASDLSYGIISLRLKEIHKATEKEIEKSEKKYRTLFDGMTEGFAIHELVTDDKGKPIDYRFIEVNPAFERLTGLRRSEIVGKTHKEVLPADSPEWFQIFSEVVITGNPVHFENYSPALKRHYDVYAYQNAPSQFAVIFMDISSRKHAELELKINRTRAELLAKTASKLLASSDPQHLVEELCLEVMRFLDCHTFFNFLVDERAGRLHLNACGGISKEEAEKIQWLDFGVAVCGCVAQQCQRIITENIQEVYDIRTELVKSYGVQAYVCHPLMNQKKLIGTLSFGTRSRTKFSEEDIELMRAVTDLVAIAMNRISTEHALQESEIRFKQLADAMPQLVWTAKPDGNIDYFNQRVCEIEGIYCDDHENWIWMPAIMEEDLKNTIDKWNNAYSTGKIYEITHRLKTKDDNYRWYLSRGLPIKDHDGIIVKWFGTSTDIHEQKVTEEKLKQSLNDLESSNRDLEQFAYIASHDLQEPIRMIKSYSQLFERKYMNTLDETAAGYLNYISDGASRMHQLVSDLLQYSRITTKVLPYEIVDCSVVIGEVLEDLKLIIHEEDAIIDIGKLPVLKGDRTQIRQLFQNFIQNAIKFRSEKRPEVKIISKKLDGFWQFTIKDNGIGIKSEYFEKIFVIFQRLHEKDRYPGTGIGLSLCKKIVERHGGEIHVESELGSGTAFTFTLPA